MSTMREWLAEESVAQSKSMTEEASTNLLLEFLVNATAPNYDTTDFTKSEMRAMVYCQLTQGKYTL